MIPGCPTPSHSTARRRAPVLKRSSNPSLRVAGLQAHATTPGRIENHMDDNNNPENQNINGLMWQAQTHIHTTQNTALIHNWSQSEPCHT